MPSATRRPPVRRLLLPGVLVAAVAVVPFLPAVGEEPTPDDPTQVLAGVEDYEWSFQGEGPERKDTTDFREGAVAPTAAQQGIVARLGATSTRWNRFGTPHLMINHDGYLSGPRPGTATDAARAFVADHRALFKLSDAAVDRLEVIVDAPLYDSPDYGRVGQGLEPRDADVAHVVTLRQRFAGPDGLLLDAAQEGLITLGVQRDGRIAYVTSSATGDEGVAEIDVADRIGAVEALTAAAADVELDLGPVADLVELAAQGPWRVFSSPLLRDVQRARLLAMPTPTDGVRLVWETTLLRGDHTDVRDAAFGAPLAFISFVDAATGEVLYRDNRLDHVGQGSAAASVNLQAGLTAPQLAPQVAPQLAPSGQPFTGATAADGACTPTAQRHGPYRVAAGTGQISVAVATTAPDGTTDDILINLYRDGVAEPVASQDLLGSPEVLTFAPAGGVPAGGYRVEVCEFTPSTGSIGYTGLFGTSDAASVDLPTPSWEVFPGNPNLVDSPRPHADTRRTWCWLLITGCDEVQQNIASRLPWDVLAPSVPTLTTLGNNASTSISEVSFLTPDTVVRRPVSPQRDYDFAWDNTWFRSDCNPLEFDLPGSNDADAATTNLFVMHNRMHDWSYHLGFTETNSNLQTSNFGNTGPTRENDPEIGNSQAGRRTFNGRDNANQITLQDGIAPITNQYLWQPLAGAFYAACTDGAYDMAVVAHEYGHAISNRMVAGPDVGTGATQGQTESWSDLIFAEYFRGYGISTGKGASALALAPYVSGNKQRGIRNYSMDKSPLNYSNLEYDGNGTTSPHANGEIWSATNQDIAEALNRRYDARFPSTDERLQLRCAEGVLPGSRCPGNRRWAHMLFDGLLLTPSGSTMLDSRDAILAADRLRFDGANQALLWRAFAKRGMGVTARSSGPDDVDAIPGWTAPRQRDAATVTFASPAAGTQVFVGTYEARSTATADNVGKTKRIGRTVRFTPGTYRFIATAPGFGAVRFTETLTAGKRITVDVPLRRNVASRTNGAKVSGDGINLTSLIDDTESTNWASLVAEGTASEGLGEGRQVENRFVRVRLSRPTTIDRVQVSAALRPADESNADSAAQSRFSALRSFDILVCDATRRGSSCDDPSTYRTAYESSNGAFPGVRPRPAAPDLTLRGFSFRPVRATHVILRVRDSQCTGGPLYQAAANPSADPVFSNPDCDSEATTPDRAVLTPPVEMVRVAELQVFAAERRRR